MRAFILQLGSLLYLFFLCSTTLHATYYVNESFENGIGNWEILSGAAPNRFDTLPLHAQIGNKGLVMHYEHAANALHLKKSFTPGSNYIIRGYFFDALQPSLATMFEVKSSDDSKEIGIGVNTSISPSQYFFRADGVTGIVASGINRIFGWHLFEIQVTDSGSYAFIDGVIAGNANGPFGHPTLTQAGSINLISSWQILGDAYYDGITVQKVLAVDEFENNVTGMTPILSNAPNGFVSITTPTYRGKRALKLIHADTLNRIHIKKSFPSSKTAVASLYYYDNMESSLAFLAEVKTGDETNASSVGVDTRLSATNYIYRIHATQGNLVSPIPRSRGWHLLEFRNGNGVDLLIDGISVGKNSSQTESSSLQLVSSWGMTGEMIFDSLLVAEPEIASDSTGVWINKVTKLSRIDFVKDDIARIRWSPTYTLLPNPDYFQVPIASTPTTSVSTSGDSVQIGNTRGVVTHSMTADTNTIRDQTNGISITETGKVSRPAAMTNAIEKNLFALIQKFESLQNEYLYGFGNITDAIGIKGGQSILIAQDNTNKRTPFWISNRGYGILVNETSRGSFGWESNNTVYAYRADYAKNFDYYVLFGPNFDTIINNYRFLTGNATMLPKSAFGYTQSKNRYTSQSELLSIANEFRNTYKIPIDTLVIDYYWWTKKGSHMWNTNWPDPTGMSNALTSLNISSLISVWPNYDIGTAAENPNYNTMLSNGYLVAGETTVDASSQKARAEYWRQINTAIISKGIKGIWLDASEPSGDFSNWATINDISTSVGSNLPIGISYPLLHAQAIYEGQRSISNVRVNSLVRGAVAGSQRYAVQSWSGDIGLGMATLIKEIKGVLNFYSSGIPYFSTDTGGYLSPGIDPTSATDKEIFLRWLQFSTFNTIMRVHGLGPGREPWKFGTPFQSYITKMINLRYRLLPYLYSLIGKTYSEGYTPVRPLVFDYQNDGTAQRIEDQFLFGPSMLINPITVLGQTSKSIYVPAGTWINFWTGEQIVSSGQNITIQAQIDIIPILVKAGAIIPLGPLVNYAKEKVDPLEIRIYPGANGSFDLYEDDGDTYGYEQGQSSSITFSWNNASQLFTISARKGSFPGMLSSRTFHVVLVKPGVGTGGDVTNAITKTIQYTGVPVSVSLVPPTITSIPSPTPIPGDIDGNGQVSNADLLQVLSHFGTNYSQADFNKNGIVDIFDYSKFLSFYGN